LALGFSQPLTEMSTRSIKKSCFWEVDGAYNLTAICEPIA
jgi:hypothetical protein